MLKTIMSNFGHPRGVVGQVVGWTMAVENRERILWAVSQLDVQPGDAILEIGFGPGVGIEQLAALAREGFIAGVDSSDVMVGQARRRNASAVKSRRVELKQASVEDLPHADQCFDKVLAINSLHHWTDHRAGLREAYRVLKVGGMLAIVEQPPSKAITSEEIAQRGDEILDLMIEAGFREVEAISVSLKRGWSILVRGKRSLALNKP